MSATVDSRETAIGLAGQLFNGCLELFVAVWKAVDKSGELAHAQKRQFYGQLEKSTLWGDGFDTVKGVLDEILSQSERGLSTLVMHLLSAIGHTLLDRESSLERES